MVISSSSRKEKRKICGVFLFSGRPDPTWLIDDEVAERLKEIWQSLKLYSGSPPTAPILGYRGCFLKEGKEFEWFAYKGVVTFKNPQNLEFREDKERDFEKMLLASAPKDMLPPFII